MDAQEFRKDFLENVKAEAAATGEGSCAAFVDSMAQYLVEAEVLPDFTPAFYTSTTSKRKIYRVDGYVFDEFDYTMNLIIADYDGVEERTMGKVVSSTNFQRLAVFVDQALNTNLYREIEMSTPCADLVDLLRLEKERIRKYRLLIFTDADVSDTLKNLDNLDIGGIPAECQIWDIDRVFRVCCSDLGRQNIEIDFREYIPEGIPCLEASSAATAEYNSYLCIIPGKVLADIYDKYKNKGDKYKPNAARAFNQAVFQACASIMFPAIFGHMGMSLFSAIDKHRGEKLSTNAKEQTLRFIKSHSALHNVLDAGKDKNEVLDKFTENFAKLYKFKKKDYTKRNIFVKAYDKLLANCHRGAVANSNEARIKDYAKRQFLEVLDTCQNAEIAEKVLDKKIFKLKAWKSAGAFTAIILTASMVDKFVEKVIIKKFVKPIQSTISSQKKLSFNDFNKSKTEQK